MSPGEPIDTLRVERRDTEHDVRLTLLGELDISTLPDAERAVGMAEETAPVLVLDLGGLTFCDSSGVRLVLLADQRARAAGRQLVVDLGNGPARRVFAALGLFDRLRLADGADDRAHPGGT